MNPNIHKLHIYIYIFVYAWCVKDGHSDFMETSPHVADWTDIVHSDWEASGVIWNSMELDYLRRQFQFENSLLAIVAISSYVVGWLSGKFPRGSWLHNVAHRFLNFTVSFNLFMVVSRWFNIINSISYRWPSMVFCVGIYRLYSNIYKRIETLRSMWSIETFMITTLNLPSPSLTAIPHPTSKPSVHWNHQRMNWSLSARAKDPNGDWWTGWTFHDDSYLLITY
jgi:hypothetical protein